MSNPVEAAVSTVTAAPKTVAGWAKARPFVFALLVFLTVVVAIRYRDRVVSFLVGLPGIGEFMAKVLGVAAAFALVTLVAGDAHAASLSADLHGGGRQLLGVGIGAAVVIALFVLRLIRGDAGPAFSVFFPREDVLDLRTPDGAFSVALTPTTAEAPAQFKITGDKGSYGGAWLKATGITWHLSTTFDQAAAGGSVVNWDELFRVISGIEILHPLWGAMLTKETGSGPIMKHLIEFVGSGYHYAGDDARAQIPAADGDTTVDLYLTYPIAQRGMIRPTDQACWIGWLDQTLLNFNLNTAATIAAVSTGAVIKAPTTVKVGLDYVLDNDLEVPTLAFWQRYTHNAGSETIRALGLGSNGPRNTLGFERILGIYELFNVLGFGGCTTSDVITAVFVEQLGLSRVTNVDMLVKNYLKVIGFRGPKSGIGASTPLHALAGNPYTMAAAPNNALNASTLGYLALRAPGLQQEITKAVKFAGDLLITQTYTATPNSGQHVILVQSIREFTPDMARELKARANRAGAGDDIPLANNGSLDKAGRKAGARGLRGLPRSIVER